MRMGSLSSVLNPSLKVEWSLKMEEETSHLRSAVPYTTLAFAYFTCYRNPPWLYIFFPKIGFLLLITSCHDLCFHPLYYAGILEFYNRILEIPYFLFTYSTHVSDTPVAFVLVILQFSVKMQD